MKLWAIVLCFVGGLSGIASAEWDWEISLPQKALIDQRVVRELARAATQSERVFLVRRYEVYAENTLNITMETDADRNSDYILNYFSSASTACTLKLRFNEVTDQIAVTQTFKCVHIK